MRSESNEHVESESNEEISLDETREKMMEGLKERYKAKSECSNANAIMSTIGWSMNDGSMKEEIK
eukprot:7962105-Karenia_brevis.AAC.1